jgi:hypothetical protein
LPPLTKVSTPSTKAWEPGTGLAMDWAGGIAGFVHNWDDRLALSYGP